MNLIQKIEAINNTPRDNYDYQIRCIHDDGKDCQKTTTEESTSFISIYKVDEYGLHHWIADFHKELSEEAIKCFLMLSGVSEFPNGFESWHETHCEVSMLLQVFEEPEDLPYPASLLSKEKNKQGSTAYYTIAKLLTDEFEALVKDIDWSETELIFELAVDVFVGKRMYQSVVTLEELEEATA